MPRYLSLHTLACLTRQGAEQLVRQLSAAPAFTLRRVLVNMTEGKMLVEYEAADRESVARWFEQQKFHHDWLLRVELESREGRLEAAD